MSVGASVSLYVCLYVCGGVRVRVKRSACVYEESLKSSPDLKCHRTACSTTNSKTVAVAVGSQHMTRDLVAMYHPAMTRVHFSDFSCAHHEFFGWLPNWHWEQTAPPKPVAASGVPAEHRHVEHGVVRLRQGLTAAAVGSQHRRKSVQLTIVCCPQDKTRIFVCVPKLASDRYFMHVWT